MLVTPIFIYRILLCSAGSLSESLLESIIYHFLVLCIEVGSILLEKINVCRLALGNHGEVVEERGSSKKETDNGYNYSKIKHDHNNRDDQARYSESRESSHLLAGNNSKHKRRNFSQERNYRQAQSKIRYVAATAATDKNKRKRNAEGSNSKSVGLGLYRTLIGRSVV